MWQDCPDESCRAHHPCWPGIGAATARLAAARGHAAGVNFRRNRPAADTVVARIEELAGRAAALQADVAREDEVVRLFQECDAKLGRLTSLVHNAGVLETQMRVASITTGAMLDVSGGR